MTTLIPKFDLKNGGATPTGAVNRSINEKLAEIVSIHDFDTLANAIATGGTLLVPPGTYNITSNTDFGTCSLVFNEGALFNVTAGVNVYIRNQVQSGDYQIFSTTGNIIVAGSVNPMWWGAVRSTNSPGATVAAANTLAFRKAAKSFYTEYVVNNGTVATPAGPQINWEVVIPPGAFYLSNGFAAPVGVPVRGSGANSLLCRLTANADSDTAIPLLTIGQTLGAAPTLAYVNDPGGQSASPFTSAGYPNTAAQAFNLYFVDQNSSVAAFRPFYPGVQFSNLFFTSCGIAIDFTSAGDITGTNIIVDQGLTGFVFGSGSQNINISNVVMYNIAGQVMSFLSNINNISFDNVIVEYPQALGIYFAESQSNMDNIKFSNCTFLMNVQYSTFVGMVRNRASNVNAFFYNCSFRNIKGPAILNDLSQSGNRFTFQDCNFDANRTSAGYDASTTMSVASIMQGTYIFTNCQFKNMFNSSVTSFGPVTLKVNGLIYSGTNIGASPQFNFTSGPGTADFVGVMGTGAGSLSTGSGLTVRVNASYDY